MPANPIARLSAGYRQRLQISAAVAALSLTLALPGFGSSPVEAQSAKPANAGSTQSQSAPASEVILKNLPAAGTQEYATLRRIAGGESRQRLQMTGAEVWAIPTARVATFEQEARKRGVSVTTLDATWNHVLGHMPAGTSMTDQQSSMMTAAKESQAVAGVGMMSAQPSAMIEYALSKSRLEADGRQPAIVLPFSDGRSITLRRTAIISGQGRYVWRGATEDTNEPATIIWWPDGRLTGSVEHQGMRYAIKPFGGSAYGIIAMDQAKMPDDHAPMRPMSRDDPKLKSDPLYMTGDGGTMRPRTGPMPGAPRTPPTPGEIRNSQDVADKPAASRATPAPMKRLPKIVAPKPARAAPVEITVMVAFTPRAARHYVDIRTDLIELAVEEANQTFRNSGIGHIRLRLVHTHQTDYDEKDAAHFDHVWRMVDRGDGYMEEIPRVRFEKKADVVVLVVDDPSGCGLATRVAADAEEAYAVVHHECAATSYTIAHEIGHIIGARHDRTLDQSTAPFPYGHGFIKGMKWRTMMSYKSGCNGCPRLPVWSNPKVKVDGEPAGTPTTNNARVLAEQASRVAGFSQLLAPPR